MLVSKINLIMKTPTLKNNTLGITPLLNNKQDTFEINFKGTRYSYDELSPSEHEVLRQAHAVNLFERGEKSIRNFKGLFEEHCFSPNIFIEDAIKAENPELVELLLNKGAKVIEGDFNIFVTHGRTDHDVQKKLFDLLISHNDAPPKDFLKNVVGMLGNVDIIKALVDKGYEYKSRNSIVFDTLYLFFYKNAKGNNKIENAFKACKDQTRKAINAFGIEPVALEWKKLKFYGENLEDDCETLVTTNPDGRRPFMAILAETGNVIKEELENLKQIDPQKAYHIIIEDEGSTFGGLESIDLKDLSVENLQRATEKYPPAITWDKLKAIGIIPTMEQLIAIINNNSILKVEMLKKAGINISNGQIIKLLR